MNIFKSLSSFLYDKEYFITFFGNEIYVYNYENLIFLGESKIILSLKNFNLHIKGQNLFVKQLDKKEILIEGFIKEVIKEYE